MDFSKVYMWVMISLMIVGMGIQFASAKTTDEKIDDLKNKTDKLEKLLEKIDLYTGRALIEVHGTEYEPGELGKVWLQLLNSTDLQPILDAACQVHVYTPDNEELIEKGAMVNANHDGIYYYDLTIPQAQGVYPAIAECFFSINQTGRNATGFLLNIGSINAGDYTDTWILDGNEHKIEQNGTGKIDYEYYVSNMCGLNTSELFLSGMTVTVNAKWTDSVVNDDMVIHVYNYTSGTWIALDNRIITPNDRVTVTNFIESNNYTRDGLVNASGGLRLKFNDTLPTAGTNKKIEMDYLQITCDEFSDGQWQNVKGSSELHVSSDKYWVASVDSGQIFNNTWPGEFHYNVTLSSQTSTNREGERIEIELPTPFPCHHIHTLYVDEVNTSFECHNPVNPDTRGASVEWLQDLNESTNYAVRIVAENWFKEQEQNWVTQSQLEKDLLEVSCNAYVSENNLTNFTVPNNAALNYTFEDSFWRACQQYLDQFYHFNKTYFEEFKTDTGIFTDDEMHFLDNQWSHLITGKDELNDLALALMNEMQLASDYSTYIQNNTLPTEVSYLTWLSNISSPFKIFTDTQNIILGNVNVSVNTSQIADSVWSYVTRTLTSFDFTVNSTVNETVISQYVWNNSGRYTHGVVLS